MGLFLWHLVPGLALAFLGLWHTFNIIKAYYLKGAAKFKSRFWYPFGCHLFKLELLELVLVFSFSVLAIFILILDFPYLSFSFKCINFEHATMFLLLAIFAGFSFTAELMHLSEILRGVSGILAASVFGQELFLIHYHSADHIGLEGHYHWLLQIIVFVSLMAGLSMTSFPGSFPAALLLSISILFQGCWFMNMGFMLWVPEFVAKGCALRLGDASGSNMHGAVMCETQEGGARARALANLQFSWILSAILMFLGCMCLNFSRKRTSIGQTTQYELIGQTTKYEQLHSGVVDVPLVLTDFKQVHP